MVDEKGFTIAIDVGGTFTDAIAIKGNSNSIDQAVFHSKASTTHNNLIDGFLNSLNSLSKTIGITTEELLKNTSFVGHGTTVGTNALITRQGSKVGLITTKGFEDTIHIQRAVGKIAGLTEIERKKRVSLRQPEPLVSKKFIRGVVERIDCFGKVVVPLEEDSVKSAVIELFNEGVESIAVCLLWSFINDVHEQNVKKIIERLDPKIPISISSDLIPKIRENARSNTVVINAYIDKICKDYHKTIDRKLKDLGFRHNMASMQVYGGVADCSIIDSISTIDSGPVGGVMGAKYLSKILDVKNIITTDMGGTSFDVSAIHEGGELMAQEYFGAPGVLARFETLIPRVDIRTLGAGGGTIAWVDSVTDTIKVGPMSAGSEPGPIFYDKGGELPTVSDIDLFLGYLNPDYFFGGNIKVNKAKTEKAIYEKLAKPLGISPIEAASGVFDIVNNMMGDAVRGFIAEKGFNPNEFVIFAYGGAGPLHASSYGELAGVRRTIILNLAPTFSAFGIGVSDLLHRKSSSILMLEPFLEDKLRGVFTDLETKALDDMKGEGLAANELEITYSLDMKYSGQIHEITIPCKRDSGSYKAFNEEIKRDFIEKYELVYGKGSAYTYGGVEIVGINVDILGQLPKPSFAPDKSFSEDASGAIKGKRKAFFGKANGFIDTPVYDSDRVKFGNRIRGPAILEGSETTILILPDQEGLVDKFKNIVIEHSN